MSTVTLALPEVFGDGDVPSPTGGKITIKLKRLPTLPTGKAFVVFCNPKRSNLLFKFAQCVGKQRPDDSDTLMPMDRMPFGLLQYQIELFTCCNT